MLMLLTAVEEQVLVRLLPLPVMMIVMTTHCDPHHSSVYVSLFDFIPCWMLSPFTAHGVIASLRVAAVVFLL